MGFVTRLWRTDPNSKEDLVFSKGMFPVIALYPGIRPEPVLDSGGLVTIPKLNFTGGKYFAVDQFNQAVRLLIHYAENDYGIGRLSDGEITIVNSGYATIKDGIFNWDVAVACSESQLTPRFECVPHLTGYKGLDWAQKIWGAPLKEPEAEPVTRVSRYERKWVI